ncbi:bacteriohemerythrin [bacterium]|nr:bacteriohemerythrin [bacterium]
MALIDWNSNLSVNVIEIDLQHQKLITLINELNDAMTQGKSKAILGKIVDGLVIYTTVHFKTEEKYFAKFGYPDANSHEKEHSAFIQKVTDVKDRFEKGEISLSIEIMNFLRDWLRKHIKGTDKQYSQFFNERGLK